MYRFVADENWVKGSLHCHSTSSDGHLSPGDVADYYVSRGYGLLALTDHGKITTNFVNDGECTVLTGIEVSKGQSKLGEPYHIVALGVDDPSINDLNSPLEVIDNVKSAKGLVIVAHPSWSSLVHEDLAVLKDYSGIEVYNTGCDVEVAKGYAVSHWDNLLSMGRECWGYAVDDAHRYLVPPLDADGGWICIEKPSDNTAAMKMLKTGQFFSSTGPRFKSLEMSDSAVHLKCSPVTRVNIVSHNGRGLCISMNDLGYLLKAWKNPSERQKMAHRYRQVEVNTENKVTTAFLDEIAWKAKIVFSPKGIEQVEVESRIFLRYMRVEASDLKGRTAWSNPIYLK
ncbi:MAG: hypothetical protein QXI71_05375 [Candidatus Bathyarchaeia archaeon]